MAWSRQAAPVRSSAMARFFASSSSARVQRAADALALRRRRHADHLETQPGLGAAELALEHARQGVPAERAALLGRELDVQFRLAQRRGQPPLEIGAPGAAGHLRVERHHGVKVGARELPDFQLT